MSKQNKRQQVTEQSSVEVEQQMTETELEVNNSAVEDVERVEIVEQEEDAVPAQTKQTAEKQAPDTKHEEKNVEEKVEPKAQKQKSSGTAFALLALLVALGVGGAGHYFTNGKFNQVEQQIAALAKQTSQSHAAEIPNFDAEKAQISQLTSNYQKSLEKIAQLEREQQVYTQQINNLQVQVQKLGSASKVESSLRLSDADFLLNNALRKMRIDNDLDTTKALLLEADELLSQVGDTSVLAIREAIKDDLNQLASLNNVDQNNLMQRLAVLANLVDELPIVDDEAEEQGNANGEVSDSLEDWQKNIEKSADSFLSHFIRISDKNAVQEKAFVAPNQEIYLRENIRLRLQIAILTVPRQQNELYKQSLEAVGSWTRSYFDTQDKNVQKFLKEVDDLIEQSIYIDAPAKLQSLGLLDQLLHKTSKPVAKIEIDENKSLEQLSAKPETSSEAPSENAQPKAEQPATAQ